MEKFCVKCGHKFIATGREVICPACKAQAAEESKKAAVLKAKRASWTGESVPVRISGRASTVIRRYGAEKSLSFAAALDALLQASDYFKSTGGKWEDITPYKSHRRDKHATEDKPQDASQASKPQGKAQDAQDVPQAAQAAKASKPQEPQDAPQASKPTTVAKATSKASKPTTVAKAKSKASKSVSTK